MANFPKNLQQKLAERHLDNAFRKFSSNVGLVDFSSNDYLGFSKEKRIAERAKELFGKQKEFKNGATGSRLLSGNYELYNQLETYLFQQYGAESALVFNSGYDANLGFFSTVPQKGDVVLYDERCHASIRDGIRLGQAKSYKFKQDDLYDLVQLAKRVQRNEDCETYVVTESVFSMDGTTPNLSKLADWAVKNTAHLVVDEAHAVGVFGTGIINQLGLEAMVFARIITFGKTLGAHGAAILGSQDLKHVLINFCRSFIYTTGLPPHTLATILAAHDFLDSEAGKIQREALQQNIDYFKSEIVRQEIDAHFTSSNSSIQVCTIGGNQKTKNLSEILAKKCFDVRPILSPTVPKGQECLRFCIHAFNTKEEIKEVLMVIKEH
jgi:8-amino-7-oxononanoate synthase